MNKREFVRCCLLGAGGLALGAGRINLLTGLFPDFPANSGKPGGPNKWSKEALFYEQEGTRVKCHKCPNECVLNDHESGVCRNRVNFGGKLYSIAYGNPCAVHVDPIEKKPLFHFRPSTKAFSIAAAGCNLRCLNCQNFQISQVSPEETQNYDLMPESVVKQCRENDCTSIAYTYSEPTSFYEYALDTSIIARTQGIKNVLKSNGYINELPLRNLSKHLDAANIDLKSFDASVYKKLSSADLMPILNTLRVLKDEGVWLEITNLVIPGWTDDNETLIRMCDWLCSSGFAEVPLHFTRFIPLYKLTQLPVTPVSTLEKARDLALHTGMKFVYLGNVAGHAAENTYCSGCRKLIVERRGFKILGNHISKGKCSYCNASVPGVWN